MVCISGGFWQSRSHIIAAGDHECNTFSCPTVLCLSMFTKQLYLFVFMTTYHFTIADLAILQIESKTVTLMHCGVYEYYKLLAP